MTRSPEPELGQRRLHAEFAASRPTPTARLRSGRCQGPPPTPQRPAATVGGRRRRPPARSPATAGEPRLPGRPEDRERRGGGGGCGEGGDAHRGELLSRSPPKTRNRSAPSSSTTQVAIASARWSHRREGGALERHELVRTRQHAVEDRGVEPHVQRGAGVSTARRRPARGGACSRQTRDARLQQQLGEAIEQLDRTMA